MIKKLLFITLNAYFLPAVDAMSMQQAQKERREDLQHELFDALMSNNQKKIDIALKEGAQVNGLFCHNQHNLLEVGAGLLLDSKENNRAWLRRALNLSGIDVNVRNVKTDGTPLMCAVLCDNLDGVKLLLTTPGIEVNAQNSHGYTSLHHAFKNLTDSWKPQQKNICLQIVHWLLQYGADPDLKTIMQPTVTQQAVEYPEFAEIIRSGRAAYVTHKAQTKKQLLEKKKAAVTTIGETNLPGGVAHIIAEYAVDDKDIAACMYEQLGEKTDSSSYN